MRQYLDALSYILENGDEKSDRTGVGTLSVFGMQMRYKMSEGFPVVTTKKLFFKGVAGELLWFLKGDTNIEYMEKNKSPVWRSDAFQHNLDKLVDAGIYSKEMKKYSPEWTAAKENYGKRIKEDS